MTGKLVLGTVHPDMIDAHFVRCLTDTLENDLRGLLTVKSRVMMSRAPAGMLHVARNEVVRGFLAHPQQPGHLLFIDTDMDWTPSHVWHLYDSAVYFDLPVVGGLAAMPGIEHAHETLPVMFDYDFNFVQPTQPIQRVFCGGSAFLMLRRDALEAVAAKHPWPTPWFDYGIRNGKAVTEEVMFAQRCWDLNIPIHVNTGIIVGHRKIHPFVVQAPSEVHVHLNVDGREIAMVRA
jgi:hypothetical protein